MLKISLILLQMKTYYSPQCTTDVQMRVIKLLVLVVKVRHSSNPVLGLSLLLGGYSF